MQRCSKCGRTYEDNAQKFCTHDGGRLELDNSQSSASAPTAYDLNQTIRTDPFDPEATITRMPDLNKTIASLPTAEIRSKETGPATSPPATPHQAPPQRSPEPPGTVIFPQSPQQQPQQQQPQQQQYYQPAPQQQASGSSQQSHAQQQQYAPSGQPSQHQHGMQSPSAARKSSRLPLIIGLVVLLLAGGAAAWYFLIYKKTDAGANSNSNVANQSASVNENANANANTSVNNNANTTEPPPPPNATRFVSSAANLDGKLAENFSNFSFYYPNAWERDSRAGVAGASNFIKVERRLPPDFTQENFAVSWYESQGTFERDEEDVFPRLIESLKTRYSKAFPEFEVLNEGETTVNGIKGYEFRFQSASRGTEKGDITLWGRIVFLPPGIEGQKNGIQLLMLATSLAPELKSADDAGVKGELPVVLNSFRIGNNK